MIFSVKQPLPAAEKDRKNRLLYMNLEGLDYVVATSLSLLVNERLILVVAGLTVLSYNHRDFGVLSTKL